MRSAGDLSFLNIITKVSSKFCFGFGFGFGFRFGFRFGFSFGSLPEFFI